MSYIHGSYITGQTGAYVSLGISTIYKGDVNIRNALEETYAWPGVSYKAGKKNASPEKRSIHLK